MATDDNSFGFDDISGSGDGFAQTPGTGVGVLRVGKRDYAVGLQWNAVDQPSKAAQEARELAASPSFGADYFCVRPGGTPQFGLGFKTQGHKAGMPSLAAHIAAARGGSWIGAYEVGGGYYLVAVRDDGILSECDRFFENADDARAAFEDFQQRSEWDQAIAPVSLDLPGTVPGQIEQLLDGRPSVRLQEVRRSSSIIRLGLAALAVGGIVIGGMMYLDFQEAERLRIEAEEALRRAQTAVLGPEEQEIQIPPMPWEGNIMAVPFLQKCVEDIRAFPADVPRWKLASLSCAGPGQPSAAALLVRDGKLGDMGGTINWITLQTKGFGRGVFVRHPPEGSVDNIQVGWAMEGLPIIPVDLETAPLSKMKTAMLEQFEERMTAVAFTEADNNEFWRGFTFSFATQEDPLGFADVIGALPGAMLNAIRYDVTTHEWKIEGKVYEQLPYQKPIQ